MIIGKGLFKQPPMFDRIIMSSLTASQTGVGTTTSAEGTISNGGVDLSQFSLATSIGSLQNTGSVTGVAVGFSSLEGLIDGVWTEIIRTDTDSSGAVVVVTSTTNVASLVSGVLTKFRVKTTISAGAGTILGGYATEFYFARNPRRSQVTAA